MATRSTQPASRLKLTSKELLKQLQEITGESQPELLEKALKMLHRHVLGQQLAQDFEDIMADPVKAALYNKEADVFDRASGDGL